MFLQNIGSWPAQVVKSVTVAASSLGIGWALEQLRGGFGSASSLSSRQVALAANPSCGLALATGVVSSMILGNPLPLATAAACLPGAWGQSGAIPKDIQTDLDNYLETQLSLSLQQSSLESGQFIQNFQAFYDVGGYVQEHYSFLEEGQQQYLVQTYTDQANGYLSAYRTIQQYDSQMRSRELEQDGLKDLGMDVAHIADYYADDLAIPVALTVGLATDGLLAEPAYWLTQIGLRAAGEGAKMALDDWADHLPSINAPSEATYVAAVFSPDVISRVLPELQAYAQTGNSWDKWRLETALYAQVNPPFSGGSSLSAQALEIRKRAFDYLIDQAANLVVSRQFISQSHRFLDASRQNPNLNSQTLSTQQITLACDAMSSLQCGSITAYKQLFLQATSPTATRNALKSMLASINQKITALHATAAKQSLLPPQQSEYQEAMIDLSAGFQVASTLAMMLGDSRTAAKIEDLAKVSLGIIEAFHTLTGIGNTIASSTGMLATITKIAGILGPIMSIASGIFQLFSILNGGGETADQAILQDLQVISQQLQAISKEVRDLSQEIAQGFTQMSTDFQKLFQNLHIILDYIVQSQQITEELAQQTKADILSFRLQNFQATMDILAQSFVNAKASLSLLARSSLAMNTSEGNATLQKLGLEFYWHAVPQAMSASATYGIMATSVNVPGTEEDMQAEALSDNLPNLPPEASVQFYQSQAAKHLSTQLPPLANGLQWLSGLNAFANLAQGYGIAPLPTLPAELVDLVKAGVNQIRFGLQIRQSASLWDSLFNQYNGALTETIGNAPASFQNAWGTYVTTDSQFQAAYVAPLAAWTAQLSQKVASFQFDTTSLPDLFSGWNCIDKQDGYVTVNDETMQTILSLDVFSGTQSLAAGINQFDPQSALIQLFNQTASAQIPCISFSPDGPPLNISSIVQIPRSIQQAFLAGGIQDISFSHVFTQGTGSNPTANIAFSGTYTLSNGKQETFLETIQSLPAGNAGQVNQNSASVMQGIYWTVPFWNGAITDSGFVTTAYNTYGHLVGPGIFASPSECVHPSIPRNPTSLIPDLFFHFDTAAGNMCPYLTCFEQQSQFKPIFANLATTFYNAILTQNWYNLVNSNPPPPAPNTANWTPRAQAALASLLQKQLQQVVSVFDDTTINNPDTPAYAGLDTSLRKINGLYNLMQGYAHFAFGDYLKGTHPMNQKWLCAPVNPWMSNGTAFQEDNGVQFTGVGGQTAVMQTQYAAPIQHKEISLIWSPVNTTASQIGLLVGSQPIVSVSALNASTYHTQIKQLHGNRYVAVTTCDRAVVSRQLFNSTAHAAHIKAFIQSPEGVEQAIHIAQATSMQLNQTVLPSEWTSVNPAKPPVAAGNEITFYGVNQSDPIGISKLQTNQSLGVMNAHVQIAWKASHRNMTVGFDFGKQQGVASFTLSGKAWKSNTWYYSTLTITPDKIDCVTCANRFGGPLVHNSTQQNNFVSDSSQLAVAISKSAELSSVTLQPVHVKGFTVSLLPEPMQSQKWQSRQKIARSVEGLTINDGEMSSKNTYIWRHHELWLKWKGDGLATVVLDLADQPVAAFAPGNYTAGVWYYTRVVPFDNYTSISTATGTYAINGGASDITEGRTPGAIPIGSITLRAEAGAVTIGDCMIQEAANTIIPQMLQNGELMNRNSLMLFMLNNMSNPNNFTQTMESQNSKVEELKETFASLQNFTLHPPLIDPNIAGGMHRLSKIQDMLVMSQVHIPPVSHNEFPGRTRTHTRTQQVSQTLSTTLPPSFEQKVAEALQELLAENQKLRKEVHSTHHRIDTTIALAGIGVGTALLGSLIALWRQRHPKRQALDEYTPLAPR